jgi:hypothetical protein
MFGLKSLWVRLISGMVCQMTASSVTFDWNKENEKEWAIFFNTSSGKKLLAYLEDLSQDNFRWAVTKTEQLSHASGWALGFSSAVALIKTLSGHVPPQENNEDKVSVPREHGHFDWLNP